MSHGELYLCRADVLEGMHAAAAGQDPEMRQIMASFIDWFTEATREQRDGDPHG